MVKNIEVKGTNVRILTKEESDYISLTDIAYYSTSTVIQKIEAIFGHFGSLGTTNAPLSLFGEEISCHAMILTAGGMAAPAA